MKYLSLDIETTGLDPDINQVIEVAAVVDDLESPLIQLPVFHCLIAHKEYIFTNPKVVLMHERIFRELGRCTLTKHDDCNLQGIPIRTPANFAWNLTYFLNQHFAPTDKITVGGKNVSGFDIPFIRYTWPEITERFKHRCMDPAPLYFDRKIDNALPDLPTCCKRAGVDGGNLHSALDDAMAVIQLVRNGTQG